MPRRKFDVNVYPGFRSEPAPYDIAPIRRLQFPSPNIEELPLHGESQFQPEFQSESPIQLSLPERLKRAYSQVPTREENKPSLLRKVGAGITAGLTGFTEGASRGAEVGQQILDAPYQSAYQDYVREQLNPLQQEYALEEAGRKTALEERKEKLEGRKVDLAERGVSLEEKAAPSGIAHTQAETDFISGWRDRIPQSDLESLLNLYKENPESAISFIKTRFPQQLSFEDRQQLQNDLIKSRERIVERQQAGATGRAIISASTKGGGKVSATQQSAAENLTLTRMSGDPEIKDFIIETDENGTLGLMTPDEIMDEFNISEQEAQEIYEFLVSEKDKTFNEIMKVQGMGEESEYEEIE